jgi:hypothetical protein
VGDGDCGGKGREEADLDARHSLIEKANKQSWEKEQRK